MRRQGVLGGLCVLVLCLVPQALADAQPHFEQTAVIRGLTNPTQVRFAPDGKVFVAEKSGLILEYSSLSDTTPTTFADLRTEVDDYWDRGLLSIALDPNFSAAHPYLWALFTRDAPIGGTPPVWNDACPDPPGPSTFGCVVSGRLVRLTANASLDQAVPGSELNLLDGWCQQYPSHSVGDLAFGPDGSLYVSGGDGANFFFVDYGRSRTWMRRSRGRREARFARRACAETRASPRCSTARSCESTRAQAPRCPATRSPEAPIRSRAASSPRAFATRFASRCGQGLRSSGSETSAGMTGRRSTGSPREPTRRWRTSAGLATKAPAHSRATRAATFRSATCSTPGAVTPPYYTYNHAAIARARRRPCSHGGSSSISGLAFYNGGPYPASYDGALFFADYSRKCIWVMFPGANGLPDPGNIETFVASGCSPRRPGDRARRQPLLRGSRRRDRSTGSATSRTT